MVKTTIQEIEKKMDKEYGLVREPSEGTVYLMKRAEDRPDWAEEVAVKLESRWANQGGSRYMVLWSDVKTIPRKDLLEVIPESELIEIFKDLN